MTASFCGVSPVVTALIVHLSYRFAKLGMDNWLQWVVAAACCLATMEVEEEVPVHRPVLSASSVTARGFAREHASFVARRRPSANRHSKGANGESRAALFRRRVSDPQLSSATAVIGSIVFPIL
jgi:hypothetical protein